MLLERVSDGPLLSPSDVSPSREDLEVVGTFNPGVARLGDETVLLVRVAERPRELAAGEAAAPVWDPATGEVTIHRFDGDDPRLERIDARVFRYDGRLYLTSLSHLRVARSTDGVRFNVEPRPALFPETELERFGLEDPRITPLEDAFWITYKAVSPEGIATALARTKDFRHFERMGVIFCPENLDVTIFPEAFEGGYAAWSRPVWSGGPPTAWAATSPDLLHWGAHAPVLHPRPGEWDGGRVGAGCVPFRTDAGWIAIYHGATPENRYAAGAALIAPADPYRVVARSGEPILTPEADHERAGFFGGVVFPCGADVGADGAVTVYYGAADETIGAARTTVDALHRHLGV